MKQGTYERTPEIKEKLRLALEKRRASGEKFGWQKGENGQFGKRYGTRARTKSENIIINYCLDCSKQISITAKRCRKCYGLSIRGDSHPRWNNGISTENQLFRQTQEYKTWRRSVFVRDNYTCQLCSARSAKGFSVKLNADHIKPFSEYPELRLNIDNGRTLCEECHKNTDTYGWKQFNKNKPEYNRVTE